jgi:hypothetical protein
MHEDILAKLEHRLGRLHARQRLGIETDHEAQVFGQGLNFFHIENWYSVHSAIRNTLRLVGLTHGGQICLPGSIPITLDSVLPWRMGAGAWQYHTMIGYTSVGAGSSVVAVRFNCPPEITLHQLRRG